MTRLWHRCPFPVLGVLFVAVISATAILGSRLPALCDRGLPLFGSVLATLLVAAVIETRRRRPNPCPWLDFGQVARFVLYVALVVIGLVVVLPGLWPSPDVEWPLRVPALLLAVAFPALLAIHLKVDHSELEESGVRRWLIFASRLPVYFICTVIVLVLLGGVLSFCRVFG
jgi:hypothetical protein